MNIAIDIGNTRLKCGIFLPDGKIKVCAMPIPLNGKQFEQLTAAYQLPITWWIAQTGSFRWQTLKAEIRTVRLRDPFKIVTRQHIPLKMNVSVPKKVGIDRLLAAFAATKKYGDTPMLIVDAGSAITIDVVQDQTFCGGAILPGLVAQSEIYPKISEKLPRIPMPDSAVKARPVYPGKNTEDAIRNGLYWGTIGAIRQFYGALQESNALLVLTGGDADYLLPGLAQEVSVLQIKHNPHLVLEGIKGCFSK